LLATSAARGQGGEPRTFAIRGAKVVPVSSAPLENATVVVSRGIIVAVGTNVTIPPDAWVVDGKGLIVYPGLIVTPMSALPAPPHSRRSSGPEAARVSRGPKIVPQPRRGEMPRMG
jgi:hypothetical protein